VSRHIRSPRSEHRSRAASGGGAGELTGIQAVREALRAGRRPLQRLFLQVGVRGERPEHAALRRLAERAGVPVELEIGPGAPGEHQGVRLRAGPLPELTLEQLLVEREQDDLSLVALDGVEDPQNLGAIARVADAAGAAGLVLTQRRAPPLSPAVSRASAGAIEWLPAARVSNLGRALKLLKDQGFWIFGADPEGDRSLFELPARAVRGRRVVVLGAEGRGLRPGIVRSLDFRVRIPMTGRVASLNVASAAAVLLFELARRDRAATPP
jgi:23S rRNA (guanosine2251-2'-O)-methyltransferase